MTDNAGFREKDHIQVCVSNCIKGFFLLRKLNSEYQ